jgi:site-specific recombinase XerD
MPSETPLPEPPQFKSTPPNKGKRYPAEILTRDEFRRILAQLPTHTWLGRRNRSLIVVMYRAGLRHSEALSLRPHHIDVDTGVIQVLHGKGDRRRTVGIDAGACAVVAEWLEVRTDLAIPPGAPLFPSGRGRQLSLSYLRALLPRLAAKAGIDKRVHPHGLRHTHAYELMMEGVEMPIIQRQLGHTSLATTDRYLNHIAPRQVIETMAKREWTP